MGKNELSPASPVMFPFLVSVLFSVPDHKHNFKFISVCRYLEGLTVCCLTLPVAEQVSFLRILLSKPIR